MPMPIGRSEKRTPIEMTVTLTRVSKRSFTEKTITENVSSHGVRAVTKKIWEAGAGLLISFAGKDIPDQARVVYCQRLTNKRFAVGLALYVKEQKSDD